MPPGQFLQSSHLIKVLLDIKDSIQAPLPSQRTVGQLLVAPLLDRLLGRALHSVDH